MSNLNVVRYVPLMKKHRVTHKTVDKYQPLTLKIIKLAVVYSKLGNRFEKTQMWMFYVLSANGHQLYWYEEHGQFHYARFRCKEICECLGIPPERIEFEDLSDKMDEVGRPEEIDVDDFRSVVRTITWTKNGPERDQTKVIHGTKPIVHDTEDIPNTTDNIETGTELIDNVAEQIHYDNLTERCEADYCPRGKEKIDDNCVGCPRYVSWGKK